MAVSRTESATRTERVAAVIVNYCTFDLTMQCIESLVDVQAAFPNFSVYVVDNASPDESGKHLAEEIDRRSLPWVHFIQAPRNGGFSYGNNLGIRAAQAEEAEVPLAAVWLLNSDTIVWPGALEPLLDALQGDVGITGSRLEDLDGTPQTSAFRFHTITREWARGLNLGLWYRFFPKAEVPVNSSSVLDCDWLSGASMLISSRVLEAIGYLDEGYFLYYEEVDYCLQASRSGWRIRHVPLSRVVHLEGQSTGLSSNNSARARMPTYWFASRARYFRKNFGVVGRLCADLAWTCGHILFRLRAAAQRKPISHLHERFLLDFVTYNFGWSGRVRS